MSSDALSPFSYVVLALVGDGGAGAHDIVRMMRRGITYWATSPSHYYAEPKRLARVGYLHAEQTAGQTRPRTHYTVTAKGREALAEWARRPAPFPRLQVEAIVRLLAADVVGDDGAIAASLTGMRAELDEIDAALDEGMAVAATLPHRERYLRLVHRFGRGLVELHREWLDEVERELG